jgi:hypothetical protein
MDLGGQPVILPKTEQEATVRQARRHNAIYFHPREGFAHFILKCLICFVLERQGKQFETEKPAAAMKVSANVWQPLEERLKRYPGRNDYDVYCIDDDQPFEVLMANDSSQIANLILRKKREYPPNTVFVVPNSLQPNIERLWRDELVPMWVLQESLGVGHIGIVADHDIMRKDGTRTWEASPFREYMTRNDLRIEIQKCYKDDIQDWKKFGSIQAIAEARKRRFKELKQAGVKNVNEVIGVGVRSPLAIERRIQRLRKYGFISSES